MKFHNRRQLKSSAKLFGIEYYHDSVGLPECPYLERYVIDLKWFSIRLHIWHASDDQRCFHDHPWWFITVPLKGRYKDINDRDEHVVKFPSIHFRKAHHKHKVLLLSKKCYTLLLTGAKSREFGFWIDGKFVKRNKYFNTYKHHPCE